MAKRKKLPKTIRCNHCTQRFLPKKSGVGLRKSQLCPFCDRISAPKQTTAEYKKHVWNIFARYIKLRDAYPFGQVMACNCVTCGMVYQWDSPDIHAGHWLDGRSKGILFDGRCVHPQCQPCNYGMTKTGGIKERYSLFMLKEYGPEVCEDIMLAKIRPQGSWTMDELRDIEAKYVQLTADRIAEIAENYHVVVA